MEIQVLEQQSLFDIAIQHAGSVEACFDIALENSINITDELIAGSVLEVSRVSNKLIENYYRVGGLKPASGYVADDNKEEGIEFWYVEFDNIVS